MGEELKAERKCVVKHLNGGKEGWRLKIVGTE